MWAGSTSKLYQNYVGRYMEKNEDGITFALTDYERSVEIQDFFGIKIDHIVGT
jgi:hypothetical protein